MTMTHPDISLDIDLSLLVGPMDDMACEHSEHGIHRAHDEGPATHYIKPIHPCVPPKIYAACELFTRKVEADLLTITCPLCHYDGFALEFLEVVGKVRE